MIYTLIPFYRMSEQTNDFQERLQNAAQILGDIKSMRLFEDSDNKTVYVELLSRPEKTREQRLCVVGYAGIGVIQDKLNAAAEPWHMTLKIASVQPLHGTPRAIGIALVVKEALSDKRNESPDGKDEALNAVANPGTTSGTQQEDTRGNADASQGQD